MRSRSVLLPVTAPNLPQLFATFEGIGTSSNPADSADICLEGGACTAAKQQAIYGQY
jgi:hypothetical protein